MRKFKKALSLIIAVTMMTSMSQASFTAFAAESGSIVAADSALTGSCGENLSYSIDEAAKTLTISGTGTMQDFTYDSQPWIESKDLIEKVVIEDGVESIGEYAFYDFTSLTSIEIPNSVTTIGSNAFSQSSIESVALPENLQSISEYLFYYCESLTSVTIPASVREIGAGAFSGCYNLNRVEIPDSVTKFNGDVFSYNTTICGSTGGIAESYANSRYLNFESNGTFFKSSGKCGEDVYYEFDAETRTFTISGNGDMYNYVTCNYGTEIDAPFFGFIKSIDKVVVEEGVTSLGDYAMNFAENLKEIYFPASIKNIGFNSIPKLAMIYADEGTYAYDYAMENHFFLNGVLQGFCGDESYDESGNKLQTPYYIFDSNTGVLTVRGEGELSYYNTYQSFTPWREGGWGHLIKEIVLEEGITGTGLGFLDSCTNLRSFSIPSTVTYIDNDWYSNSAYDSYGILLESINVSENNENYSSVDGVLYNKDKTELITYPRFKTDKSYTIPDTVKTIGDSAFQGCSLLENLTMPDGLTTIGSFAFNRCTSLNNVILPGSLTTIDNFAFSGCSSLKNVILPDTLTTIGSCGFSSCSSLTEIAIPDSVTTLESDAFSFCTSLESVKLSDSITQIESNTFNNCTSLKSLPNLANIKSIGRSAFSYCTSIKSVVIPKNVTSLDEYAFIGCSSLETAVILNKETKLSNKALPSETKVYAVRNSNAYSYLNLNNNLMKFVEVPEVTGNTVSLSGSINLNYHILFNYKLVDAGETSIKFCYDDRTVISEMNIKEALETDDSGLNFLISCPISASKMAKNIRVYYVVDGLEICISDDCSIKKYAEYIINNASTNEEYAKASDVVKAMLNYGAYSEIALLDVESSDTNSILTDEEMSLNNFPDVSEYEYALKDLSDKVNYAGSLISLKNETVIRHYFELVKGANIDELTFTVDGNTVTPVADGKYYRIDITGIKAKNLDVRYQVKVDSLTLDYSVTSYINSAVNSNLSDSVKNAAKALFLYHKAVQNYSA